MEIEKTIKQQIAHCMAFYGDQPEELMIKLESVVMEWYIKGHFTIKSINVVCPHCRSKLFVGHLEWEALVCLVCQIDIQREDCVIEGNN